MTCSSKYMYILYYANLQFKLEFYNSCSLIFFQQDRDFKKAHMHTVALVFYTFYPIQKFSIFRNTVILHISSHSMLFKNKYLALFFVSFIPPAKKIELMRYITDQSKEPDTKRTEQRNCLNLLPDFN